jgi:NACalpha-BTF3-like transcription factor
MKNAGLILLLFAAVTVSAQMNQNLSCCRHPLRGFGDQTVVNLTPLFQWWTQHQPATNHDNTTAAADPNRPLAAWQRIIGTKAGELESSWVVDAVIYTSPTTRTNARIILKNPPATEEQTYYNLKNALPAATRQITNDARTYQTATKAAEKAEDRAQASRRSNSKLGPTNLRIYTEQAARERAAATAALNDQKQLEAARTLAEKQFNAIPAVNGKYRIDWFALELGRNKQGVPIYDLGVVNPNSP